MEIMEYGSTFAGGAGGGRESTHLSLTEERGQEGAMASCVEFVLEHQASKSTAKLDAHLEALKTDAAAHPTAVVLLESLAELAQGTQAGRAALMLGLAARVVVKSDVTLEDVELRIPQSLQLSLLLHVRKLVRSVDPASQAEWNCHVHRWVLRTVVRGDDPSQSSGVLPGAPADEDDVDVRHPATAAERLSSFVSEHAEFASGSSRHEQGVDLPLVCVTSHDLAEWHLHRGQLKRAEELFRMSLFITKRLSLGKDSANPSEHLSRSGRRCTVRPERLSALALALRMLRLSQPGGPVAAPPTPQVKRDGKRFIGNAETGADADGGSNNIPISSGAVMIMVAELLRLAGHQTELIKLLCFDNVLHLARVLAARGVVNGSTTSIGSALPCDVAPLPWSYREHLCCGMMGSVEAVTHAEDFSRQVAATNCVVTLASAPAVPALVCLKMLQGSPVDACAASLTATAILPSAGMKRNRLVRQRLDNSAAVLNAVRETADMLECSSDAGLRSAALAAVFPPHLPQAAALTHMLENAVVAALENGVLLAMQREIGRIRDELNAAVCAQDAGEIGDAGAADVPETVSGRSKVDRPSDLAAFLRSAGRWGSGDSSVNASWANGGHAWAHDLKQQARLSEETLQAWFPGINGHSESGGCHGEEGCVGRRSDGEAWERVRVCCKTLGASAMRWAGVVERKEVPVDAMDEDDEESGRVERDISEVMRASTVAGGSEMLVCTYPQNAWFVALADLTDRELESIALLQRRYNLEPLRKEDDAGRGLNSSHVPSHNLPQRLIIFFRAVLSLLQGRDVRNTRWAVESARMAVLDQHTHAAVKTLAVTAIHVLGAGGSGGPGGFGMNGAVGGGGRERGDNCAHGGSWRSLCLPPALADLLVTCLCQLHRHADAILVTQMMLPAQLDRHLQLLVLHCNSLDAERACWLWNLDVLEHLARALDDKHDSRRLSWVLTAIARPQLNCNNPESIRSPLALRLMEQFLHSLLL